MKTYAMLAIGLLVVVVVTLDIAVNQRTTEDILKFVVGTVYRSFAADPPPHEFVDHVADGSSGSSKPRLVRLQGYADSIERRDNRADFTLERNGHSVQVSYAGAIPSWLVDGNEVVVTGVLSGSQLQATQMATRLGGQDRRRERN